MTEDQQVRVDSRAITIILANGECRAGEIFLQLYGIRQSGPQRIAEVINGDDNFLPLKTESGVCLVNLDQVMALYTQAEGEFDPLLALGEEHRVRVTPAVGESLEAQIFINLPSGHDRTKDFLNQQKRFLLFVVGEQVVYMARKRILLVED